MTPAPEDRLDRSTPPPPGALRPFRFPAVYRRRLGNGMQVLVSEARNFPVVSLSVMLPVSGVQEEPARAGLAALTGDLLDAGAAGRSGLEIAQELEGLGVLLDSSVSWDSTHVGFTALRSRVEPASRILADLVLRPDFPETEVERLRAERLAGVAQRRANPSLLANEVTMRFVYARESPYSRPLSGNARTVGGLTRLDVRAFHAAHFGSAGAAAIVAGDITPDEAMELLERTFGDWAGAPAASPPLNVRRDEDAPRVVLVDRPGSVQAELRVGQVGISRTDPDYFPVTVMNHILGGAFSSRLNLSLRERHGYTYGVSSAYATRRGPGPFVVSAAVQSDATAASVREIFDESGRITEEPVTSDELNDARSYLAGVFPLRQETTVGLASRLSQIAVYGLPDDYFDHYRDRILEVSADDVLRAARAHLRPREMVVVVVGDAAQLRGPLEELGEVRIFDPAELES